MGEQEQKQLAAQEQLAMNAVGRRRWHEPRELRIEQLDGGFVVAAVDHCLGHSSRQVIPNTDCLLSFIQKWVGEGQAEG